MSLFLYTGSDSSSSTSSFEDDGVAEQLVGREVTPPPQPHKKAPKDKGKGKKSLQPSSQGKKKMGNMYIYKCMTYNVQCLRIIFYSGYLC